MRRKPWLHVWTEVAAHFCNLLTSYFIVQACSFFKANSSSHRNQATA